ncbi:NUDIX domain-containing protein [Microbacterium sp. P05]|uniref:NUDIX hydrolase n=1 Tax=Microbacterium sp. P05 TaxID=3366948 RepID=UPI003744EC7D
MTREIHVSAAVVVDAEGRALLVRKRGTTRFMQPGGKPESGESAAQTLARELAEEVGIEVAPSALHPLGTFRADAANEPGFTVVAETFSLVVDPREVAIGHEIEEARWISAGQEGTLPLAPLSDVLLPLAWGPTA